MMEHSVEAKYAYAFSRCRPKHARCDDFSVRHPKMPLGQRAKIFSPYSALVGFEAEIDRKRRLYVEKRELNEEEQEELNRTLALLLAKTRGRKTVQARVRCFVPCRDENHEAYGRGGSYETVCGAVRKVDPVLTRSLVVGERVIDFSDIAAISLEEES